MTQTTLTPMDAFWEEVDRRIDARLKSQVDDKLRNHRPRGNTTIAVTIGAPGTAIVPSGSIPWAHVYVPFPCQITSVEMRGSPVGSMEVDIWIQRPKTSYADAVSILGSDLLEMVAENEVTIAPFSDWVPFIPPKSTLYIYVPSSSTVEVATINLIVKCL